MDDPRFKHVATDPRFKVSNHAVNLCSLVPSPLRREPKPFLSLQRGLGMRLELVYFRKFYGLYTSFLFVRVYFQI